MIRKILRYAIRPEEERAVLAAIEEFVRAVHSTEPLTTYEAYRVQGTYRFTHFMVFPDQEAEANHRQAPYTLRFANTLYPRCAEQPVFAELDRIA